MGDAWRSDKQRLVPEQVSVVWMYRHISESGKIQDRSIGRVIMQISSFRRVVQLYRSV